MNRSKLNIRMDILRIVKVFFNKALQEFDKNLPEEKMLKIELIKFQAQIDNICNDPLKRICTTIIFEK